MHDDEMVIVPQEAGHVPMVVVRYTSVPLVKQTEHHVVFPVGEAGDMSDAVVLGAHVQSSQGGGSLATVLQPLLAQKAGQPSPVKDTQMLCVLRVPPNTAAHSSASISLYGMTRRGVIW